MRIFVMTAVLAGAVLPGVALAQTSTAPSTTASGSATTPAPAPAPAPSAPTRWSGTQFSTTTSMGLTTIFRDLQLTPNDTVSSSFVLLPRFRLGSGFQLRGSVGFAYEWTNSDTTTRRYEPVLNDAAIQLWYNNIPTFADIKLQVAATVALPLSMRSRAQTMIFSPGVLVQAARSWEHVLGGEFGIIARATYSHPVYSYTTAEVQNNFPYPRVGSSAELAGGSAFSTNNQLGGLTNTSDTISWFVVLTQTWGDWSPGILFQMGHSWSYNPTPVPGVEASPNHQNLRTSTFFNFWLDYNPTNWLTVELGYQMFRPLLDGDGTIGNPFFSRYQSMQAYLNFNIVIDKLVTALSSGGGGAGGVIRTQNTPVRPAILRF